jgi:chitin disaccharide deacetylase
MKPNPVLKKLGYSETDRLMLLHVDDIGMCNASMEGYRDLYDFGLISCGSVMVPCPYFLSAAAFAKENPDADLGIHATLTSEWKTYRWKPLSTINPASGLIDAEGYFPHTSEEVQEKCDPQATMRELKIQILWAIRAGMKPTHMDTHMGAVLHPKLLQTYAQVGFANRLPVMALRLDEAGWRAGGADAETAMAAARFVEELEEAGMPLEDNLAFARLDEPDDKIGQYKQVLTGLPAGVTHMFIHPAPDCAELRAICPDWRSRVGDYETFRSEEIRKYIEDQGIQLIGYRAIQVLMP